ncbi:MAG: hypothetical protein UU22_C0002G0017 [Parcubacteria group bacterium GW2011_GWA2_40_8]|nr:MAG: hypothetical protein UT82_C0001G0027 [Parcubacteria group bacterium GW2011_GWB1_40_14]KKR79190.1 MAG: hypothetical protein UU22_C0002G0017 [Parcubacteria group bacterium GW2011_GWA2_40_8]
MARNKIFITAFGIFVLLFIAGSGFVFYQEGLKTDQFLAEASLKKTEVLIKQKQRDNYLRLNSQSTTDYSEGDCITEAQCSWAGQGCGGRHGVCTDQPEKYAGVITTCILNIDPDFPSNNGYSCGCILDIRKCGWEK